MQNNQSHEGRITTGADGGKMSTVIYTSDSPLKKPLGLFSSMMKDLVSSRRLAWRLLIRDISAQYRQTYLGILWAFLPPLVMAGGLLMARKANVVSLGETEIPYAAYVMLSVVLWQTFAESLMAPINALQNSRAMLAKIYFPVEALMLSKIGEVLFNFSIKLVLVVFVYIWFDLSITWAAILSPVALITLIALGFCIGTMLAPIGGLFMDISRGLAVVTGVWLFLTPVIYPVPTQGIFSTIVKLNPVTPLLVTTRELATTGQTTQLPEFILVSVLSMTGLFIGWVCYRIAMPYIIERMSA